MTIPSPIRQTIDHRADRVPIDEQCAEMIGIVAETEFDLQRRIGNGQITPAEATHRRRRRHAILATLKWLQENRDTVLRAHKMLLPAYEFPQDLDTVNHEDVLTEDEESLL
ncbi:hypothetical protein [Microvirga sp. G4-2]|uniref:hypothetical protein n=1 Tax=Microvirga sp. G4-2 TaxID=3434467 RepID=UPI004043A6AE